MEDPEVDLELDLDAQIDSIDFNLVGLTPRQGRWISENYLNFEMEQPKLMYFMQALEKSLQDIESLGAFKNVETHIGVDNDPRSILVSYMFKPKRFNYSFSAYVNKSGQGSTEIEAHIPAVFRGFENLNLSWKTFLIGNELTASLSLPHLHKLKGWHGLTEFSLGTKTNAPYGSSDEKFMSFLLKIIENSNKHAIIWEYRHRQLSPFLDASRVSSQSLLQEQFCSIKNSLKYNYNIVSPESDPTPKILQASLEVPLLSETYFIKGEYFGSIQKQLGKNMSILCTSSFGALFPLFGQKSSYFDRFSFTGPSGAQQVMKGFKPRGFGPFDTYYTKDSSSQWKAMRDDLGGDVYLASQINFFYKLPYLTKYLRGAEPHLMLFTHFGSLGQKLNRSSFSELYANTRASVGFGVSIPFPFGQAEFTFAQPFFTKPQDNIDRFQFGIRMKFGVL